MRISKATIVDFFKYNKGRGAPLNRVMLWGFFFTDLDQAKLERAVPGLEAKGLRYVDIFGRDEDDEDNEDDVLYLHVETQTLHTPASLQQACDELDDFAIAAGLESFDGFDVGNVDGSGLFPA